MARLFSRRRLLAGFASLGAIAGVFGLRSATARYYDGPVSDHFDGTRFFDRNGVPAKSVPKALYDQWLWYRDGNRQTWPEWAPSPYKDTPPARVDGPEWRISFVGHASFLLQTAGLNILIDPVWSQRVSPVSFAGPMRVNDPGIAFEALPPIDVGAGLALPLRPSRRRDAVAPARRASPARHRAARQRHHHQEPRLGRPRRGLRLA